ncbi:MAG: hypothetical protein NC548_25725 [Lachnospiraceae bacterium]|nr:hypothetical protein [Lachnospiraceae bacterium]
MINVWNREHNQTGNAARGSRGYGSHSVEYKLGYKVSPAKVSQEYTMSNPNNLFEKRTVVDESKASNFLDTLEAMRNEVQPLMKFRAEIEGVRKAYSGLDE